MSPKISVILATYNGSSRGYLSNAIESVLTQSYQNFELLIIDDGSTDNTKKTCSSYLDNDRIRYVYQENKGLAAARNILSKLLFIAVIILLQSNLRS